MAPPTYGDLGQACRDVFTKGYNFGLFKIDCKSTTSNGLEINAGGNHKFDDGKVFASLDTKYKVNDYGLTFTEKWTTNNILTTEVACLDKLTPGLKLALETSFAPDSGKKSGKLKGTYKITNATLDAAVDGGDNSPVNVNGSLVLGYQGWLGGYQIAYDTNEGKVNKNNFAVGYCSGDFQLHTSIENGEVFSASLYQRVSNRLESGVQLAWTSGAEDSTKFGIGARYLLDPCTSIRAKVNNQSQLGFGFEQKIRDGITLTLSTFVDGKNFKAGGHQVGLALELKP